MPLYEYVCQECGSHIEKIRKFSDRPLTRCEKCGGKLEQLLSSPAIQFKGSGFYINDYAKKPGGNGDKPAPSAAAGKPDDGKSSAPAKASETPATSPSK